MCVGLHCSLREGAVSYERGTPVHDQHGLVTSHEAMRSTLLWNRGISLKRNRAPLGPYSRHAPRAFWWSQVGGVFLMSEVPLYTLRAVELPESEHRLYLSVYRGTSIIRDSPSPPRTVIGP